MSTNIAITIIPPPPLILSDMLPSGYAGHLRTMTLLSPGLNDIVVSWVDFKSSSSEATYS